MLKKRLIWQLYPSYILLTLVAVFAVSFYALDTFKGYYLDLYRQDLEARSLLLEKQFADFIRNGQIEELQARCSEAGRTGSARYTVTDNTGKVLCDSHENPQHMDNHRERPEIAEALKGRNGDAIRFSQTLKADLMYVALPIRNEGRVAAVIRAAIPLSVIDKATRTIYTNIAFSAFIVIILASAISLFIARRISRPLYEMRQGAQRFAEGNLKKELPVYDSLELDGLAQAMNTMAHQLDERIKTIEEQKNELDSVLSSMFEGIIAIDSGANIISINRAAAKMLGISIEESEKKHIDSIIGNKDIRESIRQSLAEHRNIETEAHIGGGNAATILQINTSMLRDPEGRYLGVLAVLNNVTRLRKLENIRRDFVSNVSHELRTPTTSIKGFVETLLDGAYTDPENSRRFLKIIANQAERLNAIIEDLLTLSRMENSEESGDMKLSSCRLEDMVSSALQICNIKADEKKINIHLEIAEDSKVNINANSILFEQAIINLVDNAIKYSPEGSSVTVKTEKQDGNILIKVIDNGSGIPAEHLDRIFERFYRVDKARSRRMGGTGLGLAIVKHIINAHGGKINVESEVERGSTFTVTLPINGA